VTLEKTTHSSTGSTYTYDEPTKPYFNPNAIGEKMIPTLFRIGLSLKTVSNLVDAFDLYPKPWAYSTYPWEV